MRDRVLVLAVACLVPPAAVGQVFENTFEKSNVPGIGHMKARVGVSPGPLAHWEVRSRFSVGQKLTTPLERTSTHAAPCALELVHIVPDGPYTAEAQSSR